MTEASEHIQTARRDTQEAMIACDERIADLCLREFQAEQIHNEYKVLHDHKTGRARSDSGGAPIRFSEKEAEIVAILAAQAIWDGARSDFSSGDTSPVESFVQVKAVDAGEDRDR